MYTYSKQSSHAPSLFDATPLVMKLGDIFVQWKFSAVQYLIEEESLSALMNQCLCQCYTFEKVGERLLYVCSDCEEQCMHSEPLATVRTG